MNRTYPKMIFILPMWRTMKMLQESGLTENMKEMLTEGGTLDEVDLKPPPFTQVIENQPFF